jgi:hypothetical protein
MAEASQLPPDTGLQNIFAQRDMKAIKTLP